jgi:hypothetical protein
MPTEKRVSASPARKRNADDGGPAKRHAVPTARGEIHLGATEDQVHATMPPKAADDEPKQG